MQKYLSKITLHTSTIRNGNMSFHVGNTAQSLKNRKQFLLENDINFQNHICMKCNHEENITLVNWNTNARYFGATNQEDMLISEVLITQEKGLALMLLTADCLPVSFYDPATQTIALAHFSRKTISKLLPQKTICFLREQFSIDSTNLIVQIGPYIHTNSYSFPIPQPNLSPAITQFVLKTKTYIYLDLLSACNAQLIKERVPHKNISASPIDTATSPHHFSHYQSKKQKTPDGRFATILMMTH